MYYASLTLINITPLGMTKSIKQELKIMDDNRLEIYWSGKDITKRPVIGTLTTKPLTFGDNIIPTASYDVVEIVANETIYVTNQWYKPGVPQIIHKDLVQEYIPKSPDQPLME